MTILSMVLLLVSGCSNTPNSINLSKQAGLCVQPTAYTSQGLTPPTGIININNNPKQAPSCMAVTIQNNNSGMNATNIQVIANGGVSLSYVANGTTYAGTLYDQTANGGTAISGSVPSVGNVAIFDPNNCATTQTTKVNTISSDGGSCTFYLQTSSDAYAIGSYPMTLTYNYTNGNQNYAVSATITQIISLLAGGTSGLYAATNNGTEATWSPAFSPAFNGIVTAVAVDIYENIYVVSNTAGVTTVYMFNGAGSSLNAISSSNTPANATSLAVDNNGNMYLGTTNGIYTMNAYTTSGTWTQLTTVPSNVAIVGLTYSAVPSATTPTQVLYATTSSAVYMCAATAGTSGGITPASSCNLYNYTPSPTSGFTQNGLTTDTYGNLYTGNTQTVPTTLQNYYYWANSPQRVTEFNINDAASTGVINSISWVAPLSSSTLPYLYVGQSINSSSSSNQSVMFGCQVQTLNGCVSLVDNGSNILNGNVYATAVDGANNIYAIGNGLNINNSTTGASISGPFTGAYIGETINSGGSTLTPTGAWTGITGNTGVSPTLTTADISLILQ